MEGTFANKLGQHTIEGNLPITTPDEEIADTTVTSPEPDPVPPVKPSIKKLLRKFAILLLVITVAGKSVDKVLEVVQMKSGERQEKIQSLNDTMNDGLNHMRPVFVAGKFLDRLQQPHGLVFGQWDAPFNAQIAIDTLNAQHDLLIAPMTAQQDTLEGQNLSLTLPDNPLGENSVNRMRQNRALNVQVENVRVAEHLLDGEYNDSLTTIKKWEIGTQHASVPVAFLNALLALPDAYLDLTTNLLPHLPWAYRVIVVLLVFLTALIIAGRQNSIKPALWFLFLLPVAVSLLASLCAGLVWGYGTLFHLVAPTLSVTGGAAISSFLIWTSSKVAEHHLVEGILHRLPKTLTGE